MKKALRVTLIVILVLAILATACVLLYRHFVTNQIMDRGGMENPFLEDTETAEAAAAPEAITPGTAEDPGKP